MSHLYGVGSTRLCKTTALHASCPARSTSARPQLLTLIFTHSDHVFLGLLCFHVTVIRKVFIVLILDVARSALLDSSLLNFVLSKLLIRQEVKCLGFLELGR